MYDLTVLHTRTAGQPSSSTSISELVVNVLQLVEYDIGGPPAVTLYRVMYTFYAAYCHQQHTIEGREVGRYIIIIPIPWEFYRKDFDTSFRN